MDRIKRDIIIIGFAIFSTFFGAGNLIFPPYLGVLTGSKWMIAFLGFVIGDIVLAIMAIIASGKYKDKPIGVLSRCGDKFATFMGVVMLICIGPLMSLPRTAATAYEISVAPLLPQVGPLIFAIVYFAITLFFTIKPSDVVDNIGKILTPALLVALLALIVKGLITPLGTARVGALVDKLFATGLSQGYQTMDAFGGTVIAIIIIASVNAKGYTDEKLKIKMTANAGIVAGVALTIVYAGLCYLGVTVSNLYGADIGQTELVVLITNGLMGTGGQILLGIIVILACLTTAIGVTSAVAQYFFHVSKEKLKYEWIVIFLCVFSAIVSNFGVSTIIQFSVPILLVIYPIIVSLILVSMFTDKIKNDNVFKAVAYTALVVSFLTVFGIGPMEKLPFANLGFNWAVPVLIGGIIGNFIPMKHKEEY